MKWLSPRKRTQARSFPGRPGLVHTGPYNPITYKCVFDILIVCFFHTGVNWKINHCHALCTINIMSAFVCAFRILRFLEMYVVLYCFICNCFPICNLDKNLGTSAFEVNILGLLSSGSFLLGSFVSGSSAFGTSVPGSYVPWVWCSLELLFLGLMSLGLLPLELLFLGLMSLGCFVMDPTPWMKLLRSKKKIQPFFIFF